MAYRAEITCRVCGLRKPVMVGSGDLPPTLCYECQREEEELKRKRYFEKLDKMTLEERVRRIEELLFDEPWEHTHPELMKY